MTRDWVRRAFQQLAMVAALTSVSIPTLADTDASDAAPTGAAEEKPWSVEVIPYLWLAGMDGSLTTPTGGSISSSQSFASIASNFDAGFAGAIDLRYRRLHVFSDNIWIRLHNSTERSGPVVTSTDLVLETAFGTVGAGYELPLDGPVDFDLYLGARWWLMSTDVTQFNNSTPIASGGAEQVWADAVGGVRVRYAITDDWRIALTGDVGGGGSDLTWMVTGSLNWMINRHFGLTAAYRVLGVDYRSDGWLVDLKQQGLLLGMVIAL